MESWKPTKSELEEGRRKKEEGRKEGGRAMI